MSASRRYLLISPCRDGGEYPCRTLDSVAASIAGFIVWIGIHCLRRSENSFADPT